MDGPLDVAYVCEMANKEKKLTFAAAKKWRFEGLHGRVPCSLQYDTDHRNPITTLLARLWPS
jgi:hypothetical protein